MQLSEAIRLGAMMRPRQAFEMFYSAESGGSCAMGAAFEAVGCHKHVMDARPIWPWLYVFYPDKFTAIKCPSCYSTNRTTCGTYMDMIVHLNDDHRWTREAIADWVATVEPQPEHQPATVNEEEVITCP